jgi:hypothetical protein
MLSRLAQKPSPSQPLAARLIAKGGLPMAFDLDCAGREPLAPDATALVKLAGIAEALGPDELAVLRLVAEPLRLGRAQYGTLVVASLRHSCASALILGGTDCLEVAKFLGYAKPTVTMSVYAHWFNTRKTAGTMTAVAGAVFGDRGSSLVAVGHSGDTSAL